MAKTKVKRGVKCKAGTVLLRTIENKKNSYDDCARDKGAI